MKVKSIFALLFICLGFSWDAKADNQWIDNVVLNGDLRYRLESIDQEYEVPRHRNQFRARINFETSVSSDLNVIIGFGSGSDGDPVSNDQTLGAGFSSKPIWLDLAYLDYYPINGITFYAGKMNNPFKSVGDTELIWDSDFNPEGFAIIFEPKIDNVRPFIREAFFWIEERKDDEDSFVIGSEFGLKVFKNSFYVLGGGRYIHFEYVKDHQVLWDSRNGFGNSVREDSDRELYYLYAYRLLGEFAEIGGNVGGIKLSLFAEYVNNTYVNTDNKAWLVGVALGECKEALDFCYRYTYRKTDKDAVVGIFSDSDFSDGMTNSKGHEFNFGSNLSNSIKTELAYFNSEFGDLNINYQRVQIDLSVLF